MGLDKCIENKSMQKSFKRIDSRMKDVQVINTKKEQEWLNENKEAIEKQNKRIEREGSFSDAYRRF